MGEQSTLSKYFAYGSNMSASVMEAECPSSRFIGRAQLPQHRLAFTRRSVLTGTGVADLIPDIECAVWGIVYELTPEDLESLDRKEGSGWAYERREVRVTTDDGAALDAAAYFVIEKAVEQIAPSAEYLQRLIDAGHARGLPSGYLDAVAHGDAPPHSATAPAQRQPRRPWSSDHRAATPKADDPRT